MKSNKGDYIQIEYRIVITFPAIYLSGTIGSDRSDVNPKHVKTPTL